MENRDTWSGRTFPELSAATEAKTSGSSSKKSSKSSTSQLLSLNLRKADGHTPDASWEMGGQSLGELTTLNSGECPSAAVESRLSQILEENPLPKYSLSATACQGILRRAERRGKELPQALKIALEVQSGADRGTESTEPILPDATVADGARM